MTEVSQAAERLREYGTENIPCDRPIHVLLCEVAGWALPLAVVSLGITLTEPPQP